MSLLDKLPFKKKSKPKPIDKVALRHLVMEALKTVYDPEIPVNIFDLGLIYEIWVDETGKVDIKMTLTTPACPVAQTFPQTVEQTVSTVDGVASVEVELVWDPPWTQDRMSEVAKLELGLY